MNHIKSVIYGSLTVILSLSSYLLTFNLNAIFNNSTLYSQGINILYIPAGIKFISILVGGLWGATGSFFALLVVAQGVWHNASSWQLVCYSLVSTSTTWGTIICLIKYLRIKNDLSNLRFINLPVMALFSCVSHAVATNLYLFVVNLKTDNYFGNTLAMTLGDFLGIFICLTILWLIFFPAKKQ